MKQFSIVLIVASVLAIQSSRLLAICQEAAAAPLIQRETEAFIINVHADSKALADDAVEVAKKTWEVASKLYGADLPEARLFASLYRTTEDYEKAEQELTGGRFKRNLAFAHPDSLTAHVALQPYLTDQAIADVGLPKQSAQLLAHEMAHLVRYHWMSHSAPNHPQWLLHGVATWIDQKVAMELKYSDSPQDDPNTGRMIQDVQKLLKENKLPAVQSLLDDEKLEVDFYTSYGLHWIFVDMLMTKHETEFRSFLKELRSVGGGSGFSGRASKLLLKHLQTTVQQLDTDWAQHIGNQKFKWVDHIRALETGGKVWHQIAFPDVNAVAWQQEPLPAFFEASVDATILRNTGQQLNIRIGQPSDFTQFSLTAGFGLNVFHMKDNQWAMVLEKKMDNVKVGVPMKLKLSHDPKNKRVQLKLNEIIICESKIPDGQLRLALSAQNGTAVAWERFTRTKNERE